MNFRFKILKYLFLDLPKKIKSKKIIHIKFNVGKDIILYDILKYKFYCYKNYKYHHKYIPAVYSTAAAAWYYEGREHRKNGPAITYSDGGEEWIYYGKFHRKNGPAFNYKNRKYWLKFGIPHREDGPAIIETGRIEWWVNGNKINCNSNEEFLRIKKIISFY